MLNEKIIYYRKKNGLSQEELAGKLLVSRQTVSQWETGQTLPTVDNLIRLREIFGVTMDELISDAAPTEEAAPAPQPREIFSFILTREEFRRAMRSTWEIRIMVLVALTFAIPVFLLLLSYSDLVGEILPTLVICLVLLEAGAFTGFYLRKNRALDRLCTANETIEIRSYDAMLTQTALKNGEAVRVYKMAYDDIAAVEDSKTIFRISDRRGGMIFLPKRAMDPDGSLFRWLCGMAEEYKRKTSGKGAVVSVLCTAGVLIILSKIAEVVSRSEDLESVLKYFWIIPAAGLLISLFMLVRGIVRARKKRNLAAVQIVFGVLFSLICTVSLVFSVLIPKASAGFQQTMLEIESQLGIDLPDNAGVRENIYKSPKSNGVRLISSIVLSLDRSTSLAFDEKVASEPKWIRGKLAFPLAPVWNTSVSADTAEYVMLLNLTTGQFNELPKENGTYTCLNVFYRQEDEQIIILKYEIDYQRK